MRMRAMAGVILAGSIFWPVATASARPAALGSPSATPPTVSGSGSTTAQIVVDQWRADVATPQWGSLNITYEGDGDTAGRGQYSSGAVDFAVTELPYQRGEPFPSSRPFVYTPITASGIGFMYNLSAGGQRVTDLKLRPSTLGKIFTGQITNWSDPKITADYGRSLPSLPIVPVIRSDSDSTSFRLSQWLNTVKPAIWGSFCARVQLSPCQPVAQYPAFPGAVSEQGADGVAGYVGSPYGAGAITYVGDGYAQERTFPMVSVRNRAGVFVPPATANVTAALAALTFGSNGKLDYRAVYTDPSPVAYPIIDVSLAIVPTTTAAPFSVAKGAVLFQFLNYALCAGQAEAAPLGSVPLPSAVVSQALTDIDGIPGAPGSAHC